MDERVRIQALLYPWVSLSAISSMFRSELRGPWEKVGAPLRPVLVKYSGETLAMAWFPDRSQVQWLSETEVSAIHGAISLRFPSHNAGLLFFTRGWCTPWNLTAWSRVRSWARFLGLLFYIKDLTGPSRWESLGSEQLISRIRINLVAAAAGISGLAQIDPFSRQILEDVPLGRLEIRVRGMGESLALLDIEGNGLRYAASGSEPLGKHRAILEFADTQTAWKSILGKEDHLSAVGNGKIKLNGFIPLADGFGHLVDRLQCFINPLAN